MSRAFLLGAALAICPVTGGAQATIGLNPVYRRAQTMVNDGNAAAGRALVDSMIAAAIPGSNDYAEAVYWRAVLTATAADAEMDYRRVVVDYPLSPRVGDALIRLAQLEMARGNYDGALKHLSRLAAEHPDSPARARAGYWTARALFDKNDTQGGCAATADALERTSASDPELRNQITYLNQRCAGVVLTAPTASQTVPASTPVSTPVSTVPVSPQPASAPPVTSPPAPVTVAARPADVAVDSVKSKIASPPIEAAPMPAKKAASRPSPPAAAPPSEAPSSGGPSGERVYSVQVAAYSVKLQADAMVVKLRKSGYEARVDGTSAPFRVRIGKYGTQAQASAVQRSLKVKQITGFVVQADIR